MDMKPIIRVKDLGMIPYQQAWELQEQYLKKHVQFKSAPDPLQTPPDHLLLLCEHPAVFTLGKSGKPEHLLRSPEALEADGIGYVPTNRGGDITFHGPGQLVGYPILDLERFYTDIGRYLRELEAVIMAVLAHYGLEGMRSAGETGVWLDAQIPGKARKICAMGVRCSRWVTMHGFALNVNTELAYFDQIIPCGIRDKGVTSLEAELGRQVPMEEVKVLLQHAFENVFGVQLVGGTYDL
jgi:lipoyl(octanoyl) transferase